MSAAELPRWSVKIGLRWLIVPALNELEATSQAVWRLGLRSEMVPGDVVCTRATVDECRRFAALVAAERSAGGRRRRDVKGVTGRRHVDPGTGPLFDQDGAS